jgi:hypothetical protein
MASRVKGIPLSPLTGALDARSAPDQMVAGSLRMRQNFQTVGANKLRRGTGWKKLLSGSNYNNSDFHDQLLTFTPGVPRQPVTFLLETESTRGTRNLFVGKQGAIAKLNQRSGNYRILGSGYGGSQIADAAAPRFRAAQLGDYLALTNNLDKPIYTLLEGSTDGTIPLVHTFDDLDVIGLTRASVVWVWKNVLFFGDVTLDNEEQPYTFVWSDYENPLGFDPAKTDSITGTIDLDTNERILAFAESPGGNSGLIYTTRGMWELAVVGGVQDFDVARRYNAAGNPGVAVLKYPNTLVALPESHLYMAEDGFYQFTPWSLEPERVEWLHRASSLLYDNIDNENCMVHVGAVRGNEVWFFVASRDAINHCPDHGIRINMKYRTVDYLDFGCTAICSYRSYDVGTIRDFIIENRICDVAGLAANGYAYTNEGLPRVDTQATAPFVPTCIYTTVPKTIDGYPEIGPEDWEQAEASAESLCALLGDKLATDDCGACAGDTLLVGARSDDWCLKQMGDGFYRERCLNPSDIGITSAEGYTSSIGSYVLDGYDSIITFAPLFVPQGSIGQPLLNMAMLVLNAISAIQTPPSQVLLEIGISGQMVDPNTDSGQIVWFSEGLRSMKFITDKTLAQHLEGNTIPEALIRWPLYREGRVLYARLTIGGKGGDSVWSGCIGEVEPKAALNY